MNKIITFCLMLGLLAFGECQKSCAEEGKMCAGFAGIRCCDGHDLECYVRDKNVADASGTCVKPGCSKLGESCGGIRGLRCCAANSPMGLKCLITESHPDALGKCVANSLF